MKFFTVKIALLTVAAFAVDAQKTTCPFDVCIKDCVKLALTNAKPDIISACEDVCDDKEASACDACKKCKRKEKRAVLKVAKPICEDQDDCKRPTCDGVQSCDDVCDCKDAADGDACKAECQQCKAGNKSAMEVCFSSCAKVDCDCDCDEKCSNTDQCAGQCSEECGGDGSNKKTCKMCMKKCEAPCKQCFGECEDQKCVGDCSCKYPWNCKGKKGKKGKKPKKGKPKPDESKNL